MDYIVRAFAADDTVRAFAIDGTQLCEEARKRHGLSPVVSAALGRLLMGGAMMGVMMKGDKDILTVKMKGDGPAGSLTVTADSKGNVKGYADNPNVDIPLNYAGKLDVGAAIGYGDLTVIKDQGLKEPYVSQVPLGTSEVADDLTFYFYKSEQTPSSVALGVYVSAENKVTAAGGFIVQMMPGASESLAAKLEERLTALPPVTDMMREGLSPENILEKIFEGTDLVIGEKTPARFLCSCSKEHFAKALVSMGKDQLSGLIEEAEPIELRCEFCGNSYEYTVKELKALLDTAMAGGVNSQK